VGSWQTAMGTHGKLDLQALGNAVWHFVGLVPLCAYECQSADVSFLDTEVQLFQAVAKIALYFKTSQEADINQNIKINDMFE
jgi:hypothetical protein